MNEIPYRIHFRQGEFELEVEGDRAFVESYVAAFIAGTPAQAVEKKIPRSGGAGPARPVAGKPKGIDAVDVPALKTYMKGRKPASNKERYLTYMGFLKTRGRASVSDTMIRACFTADGLSAPPTGRQNFSILRGDGLVKAGSGRGLWSLTPEGEENLGVRSAGKSGGRAERGRKPKAKKASAPVAKGKVEKKGSSKGPAPKKVTGTAPRKVAPKKVAGTASKKAATQKGKRGAIPKAVSAKAAKKILRPAATKIKKKGPPVEEAHGEEFLPDAMAE